jgi:nucleoside-diphosphate-sugar epimerase
VRPRRLVTRSKVIAVSRFSDPASRDWLHSRGVETVAADLLDHRAVAKLPNSPNVVYLVGMKFGTSQSPSLTWATNTVAPMLAAERYAGARMVALSTGNVYPMMPIDSTGSRETDPLTPLGEYANAAVARERVFEYFSIRDHSPLALIRLNYAHDLRYGVISDLAQRIANGQPIDLTMGHFNAIWQGDANELILRALSHCGTPPAALNLTSPEIYRVRDVAEQLAKRLGVPVEFTGSEAETALLSDATRLVEQLGRPKVGISKLIEWIADWTRRGGRTLGKPTGFETRDGKF